MAINKVLLAKQINGEIEYLYPKTTADMVLCKYGHIPETTVQESLDYISNDIADLINYKMDSPKNEMGDPVNGNPGQILSINENYEKEWIDYIPNGLSVIRVVGTNDGGEWGYDAFSDRYQSQVVQVSNYDITPNSQITIQFTDQQAEIFQEKNLSFLPETRTVSLQGPNGEITYRTYVIVYAYGDIPENSYTLQVTVTEVA